jgi:hypothetical protein
MRWATGLPERFGADGVSLAQYTHLIRHPGDPEATPNHERPRDGTAAWRRALCKQEAGSWRVRVHKALVSHGPMSFQALCVTLINRDADKCMGTPIDDALWQLVAEGVVQWSVGCLPKFRVRP